MLRHRARRVVRSDAVECAMCLLDPARFFRASRYTHSVAREETGVYQVIFKWRKWGMTRYFPVRIRVEQHEEGEGRTRVVYEPTGDSPYFFRMVFDIRRRNGGAEVEAEAEMKAGLMADLLGRKDYASFVEELLDRGIKAFLEERAKREKAREEEKTRTKPTCTTCALYDEERGYCYFLERRVEDPEKPPCKGQAYVAMKA